ncbi:MAG: carboxypeptidase-like regulatory domain-containing protein [Myxococcota bacterium]
MQARHTSPKARLRTPLVWLMTLCVCVAVIAVPSTSSAVELRVRAEGDLTLSVTTAGTLVKVSGFLRDELADPLAQRRIDLEIDEVGSPRSESAQVFTNRRGAFSYQQELRPGEWQVRAEFAESKHVTGDSASQRVTVEPSPVELSIRGPQFGRLTGAPAPVQVRASVGSVGLSVSGTVYVNGRPFETFDLDDFGRANIDVSRALEPGDNPVEVRLPAGPYRESASDTWSIRAAKDIRFEVQLEQVLERLERGVAVTGEVFDDEGPIEGARIRAKLWRVDVPDEPGDDAGSGIADSPYERTVQTNSAGKFRAFFSGDELEDGAWQGRATLEPEFGEGKTRDTDQLEFDRTVSRWVLNSLGVLAVLVGVGLVLHRFWAFLTVRLEERRRRIEAEKREERAFREEETLVPVSLREDDAGETPVERDRVGGMIWDSWRSRPIEGALVRLVDSNGSELRSTRSADGTPPDAGRFRLEDLPKGDFELRVECHGFMPGKMKLSIPHAGKLTNIRLDLVAVPLKIRRLYGALIEQLEGEDLWGLLSPREIQGAILEVSESMADQVDSKTGRVFLERVRAALSDGPQRMSPETLVDSMTQIVEETYFSGRVFGEDVWKMARAIAVELRRRFDREATS